MGVEVLRTWFRFSSVYLLLLTLVTIITEVLPCDPTQQCCQLTRCWHLFERARESLGVQEIFLGRRGRKQRLTAEQKDMKCRALRTFHHCMNEPRDHACLGDLSFHSAHKGVESQMNHNNCSLAGTVYTAGVQDHISARRPTRPRNPAQVCTYRGPSKGRYKTCALFGDPHVRTFSGELQTCRIEGAWPVLSNQYLTVQATHDAVGLHTATAITKLTVMIRRNTDCAADHYVTYQAHAGYLPAAFDDGRSYFGRERSVRIREKSAGKHVEIYIRYIDTTLIIRQIGQYFTISVRMPEHIAEETSNYPITLQLCSQGCPSSERIDYRSFLAQKRGKLKNDLQSYYNLDIAMSRQSAEEHCKRAGVVDFYFDSCIFDLLTTGDANFTVAASVAMADLIYLDPNAWLKQQNRTNLQALDAEYEAQTSVASRSSQTVSIWTLLVLYYTMCFIQQTITLCSTTAYTSLSSHQQLLTYS